MISGSFHTAMQHTMLIKITIVFPQDIFSTTRSKTAPDIDNIAHDVLIR
jgi:hypothetical protein